MFGRKNTLEDALVASMLAPREHHHSHTTTIHEHRAPTDDSIRLAKEMEDKVRNSVLATFGFPENTLLHAQVIAMPHMFSHAFRVQFMLNVERISLDVEIPPNLSGIDAVKYLFTEIANELVARMVSNIDPTMLDNVARSR